MIKQPLAHGQKALSELLLVELKNHKTVLWLISGGSNIEVAVAIMNDLRGFEKNLIVTLSDERYGPVGHAGSNWQQLLAAGFDHGKAQTYPVLQEGLSMAATARMFELTLSDCLDKADVVVGQLGIGTDGHVSGILPHSPATIDDETLVAYYVTPQFSRITTTFYALKQIDCVYSFVYGADKKDALETLALKKLSLAEQPSQILKNIKHAYVYNDQIGEA